MTAITMPKFAIKKLDVTDEQFATVSNEGKNRFLGPGQHDVKIKEVRPHGPCKGDASWFTFRVVYTGANGAEISDFVKTPTTRLTYAGAKTPRGATFPLKLLGDFFRALGEDFAPSKCQELLQKYFGSSRLVGKELTLQVGYKGDHAAYDTSTKGFILADKDGIAHNGPDGVPLTFSSRDEVKAYCLGINKPIEAFPNVTAYVPGELVSEESDAEDDVAF